MITEAERLCVAEMLKKKSVGGKNTQGRWIYTEGRNERIIKSWQPSGRYGFPSGEGSEKTEKERSRKQRKQQQLSAELVQDSLLTNRKDGQTPAASSRDSPPNAVRHREDSTSPPPPSGTPPSSSSDDDDNTNCEDSVQDGDIDFDDGMPVKE